MEQTTDGSTANAISSPTTAAAADTDTDMPPARTEDGQTGATAPSTSEPSSASIQLPPTEMLPELLGVKLESYDDIDSDSSISTPSPTLHHTTLSAMDGRQVQRAASSSRNAAAAFSMPPLSASAASAPIYSSLSHLRWSSFHPHLHLYPAHKFDPAYMAGSEEHESEYVGGDDGDSIGIGGDERNVERRTSFDLREPERCPTAMNIPEMRINVKKQDDVDEENEMEGNQGRETRQKKRKKKKDSKDTEGRADEAESAHDPRARTDSTVSWRHSLATDTVPTLPTAAPLLSSTSDIDPAVAASATDALAELATAASPHLPFTSSSTSAEVPESEPTHATHSSDTAADNNDDDSADAVNPHFIQCSKCSKWRVIPDDVDPASLPQPWHCDLTSWPTQFGRCIAVDESMEDGELWPGMPKRFMRLKSHEQFYRRLVALLLGEASPVPPPPDAPPSAHSFIPSAPIMPDGELERFPHIRRRPIDLFLTYTTVLKLGGYDKVSACNQWRIVQSALHMTEQHDSSQTIRRLYKKLLYEYEQVYHAKGKKVTPSNTTASSGIGSTASLNGTASTSHVNVIGKRTPRPSFSSTNPSAHSVDRKRSHRLMAADEMDVELDVAPQRKQQHQQQQQQRKKQKRSVSTPGSEASLPPVEMNADDYGDGTMVDEEGAEHDEGDESEQQQPSSTATSADGTAPLAPSLTSASTPRTGKSTTTVSIPTLNGLSISVRNMRHALESQLRRIERRFDERLAKMEERILKNFTSMVGELKDQATANAHTSHARFHRMQKDQDRKNDLLAKGINMIIAERIKTNLPRLPNQKIQTMIREEKDKATTVERNRAAAKAAASAASNSALNHAAAVQSFLSPLNQQLAAFFPNLLSPSPLTLSTPSTLQPLGPPLVPPPATATSTSTSQHPSTSSIPTSQSQSPHGAGGDALSSTTSTSMSHLALDSDGSAHPNGSILNNSSSRSLTPLARSPSLSAAPRKRVIHPYELAAANHNHAKQSRQRSSSAAAANTTSMPSLVPPSTSLPHANAPAPTPRRPSTTSVPSPKPPLHPPQHQSHAHSQPQHQSISVSQQIHPTSKSCSNRQHSASSPSPSPSAAASTSSSSTHPLPPNAATSLLPPTPNFLAAVAAASAYDKPALPITHPMYDTHSQSDDQQESTKLKASQHFDQSDSDHEPHSHHLIHTANTNDQMDDSINTV